MHLKCCPPVHQCPIYIPYAVTLNTILFRVLAQRKCEGKPWWKNVRKQALEHLEGNSYNRLLKNKLDSPNQLTTLMENLYLTSLNNSLLEKYAWMSCLKINIFSKIRCRINIKETETHHQNKFLNKFQKSTNSVSNRRMSFNRWTYVSPRLFFTADVCWNSCCKVLS